MIRFRRLTQALWTRPILIAQIFVLVFAPGCVQPGALEPRPGVLPYRAPLQIEVSGGRVDVGGGNLQLAVDALSIDTWIGTLAAGASYNSASGDWTWSFALHYDGSTFVDGSGAIHDLSGVAAGQAVPGTHWVKLDETRIKTKGGLLHEFDPETHALRALSWGEATLIRVVYDGAIVAGAWRPLVARRCDAFDRCHFVFEIAYDAHGCVARLADRAGRVALFDNDPQCRLVTARDPVDVARDRPGKRFEYFAGQLVSVTNSEGERTAYDHLEGRVVGVRQIGPNARVTRFEYGSNPVTGLHFTRVRDARGGDSVYRYDDAGRLHSQVDALGDETRFEWSGLRPSAFIDAAGAITSWTYEGDDPASMTLPSGNTLVFEYAPSAHDRDRPYERPLLRASDGIGLIEQRQYDAVGRLSAVTNGAGETTAFAYEGDGLLMMISTPDGGLTWLMDHGEHGHPGRAIRRDYTDFRRYDEVGNQIDGADIRDPLSPGQPGIGRLGFDENRRVRTVELSGADSLADGLIGETTISELTIERRSDGRIVRVTRPYGGDSENVHDEFGDLVLSRERVDGVWRTTRWERDAAGDVTAIELANGMRREYARDAVGRIVETRLLRDGVTLQSLRDTIVQDRLVARLDSAHGAPELFFRDAAGRIARIVHPGGEVRDFAHDLRSREIRRSYRMSPAAEPFRVIERSWDGADREIGLRDGGEEVLVREISAGRIEAIRYGSGLVRQFEYEPDFALLVGTRLQFPGSFEFVEDTQIAWSACAIDALCLTLRTDVPALAGGPTWLRTYEGHRLGPYPSAPTAEGTPGARLLTWQPNDIPGDLASARPLYHFDPLGNWLGVTDLDQTGLEFVFNAERNRLLASQGEAVHTYAWDEAGFVRERDGVTFAFSPNGRPTAIGSTIALEWDVLGRPISSTIDGVTTRVRFGGDVLADGSGAPLRLDLDEVVIDLQADRRFYRHLDFRGNVQLVSDHDGVAVLHRSYSPFAVAETFGDHPDGRSFAGGSEIAGILMLGARLYDPDSGRFLSPDPVEQVVNQFAYTLGNPVFLWDPSGESAQPTNFGLSSQQMREMAGYTTRLGGALVAAGLTTGNYIFLAIGAALMFLAFIIKSYAESADGVDRQTGTPTVTYEDMPSGASDNLRTGSVRGSEVGDSACSPTAITASRSSGPSLAVLLLQLAAAAGLAGWLGGRRRRR